jgi:hypothetical protein
LLGQALLQQRNGVGLEHDDGTPIANALGKSLDPLAVCGVVTGATR